MKVLVLHNHYRLPGGEDVVAQLECQLMRQHGIEVIEIDVDQEVTQHTPPLALVCIARSAAWSESSHRMVLDICHRFRPDVAHVHNFWMKLSPSVHRACHRAGVPTVQTLHNFRLLCTNALLLRNGRVCEDCVGKVPWRGVLRSCYHDSMLASAAVARMIVLNRLRGTWDDDVDAFIAPSEHARAKLVAGKVPAGKIFVKPNFAEDSGRPISPSSASKTVVYAGRLTREKGIDVLLTAWAREDLSTVGELVIVGDGPDRTRLEGLAATLTLCAPRVTFAGATTREEVLALVQRSRAVVLPSIWFESFGMIIVEAFARGRPAVVSDLGALNEVIQYGRAGLTFPGGDSISLGSALKRLLIDDELADEMGRNARSLYLSKYTPERNLEMLMSIYRFAIERRGTNMPERLKQVRPPDLSEVRAQLM